jgi:hypothetical protein
LPAIPIATSVAFDPVVGSLSGLSALLIKLRFYHDGVISVVLQLLSLMASCGLGALIARKDWRLAGLSTLVTSIVGVFILKRQMDSQFLILAIVERMVIHGGIILALSFLMLLIKRWCFGHLAGSQYGYADVHPVYTNNVAYDSPVVGRPSALNSNEVYSPIAESGSVYNTSYTSDSLTATLWHKLLNIENLNRAWERVLANNGAPGVDGVTVESFSMNARENISVLQSLMERGQYQPSPLKRFSVPKSSGSLLSIPTVRDRIVQQALMQVLIPIFDPKFIECSFAYRPGRSAHHALKRVDQHIREGNNWILDGDIESFFDTVDHRLLLQIIGKEVQDTKTLGLIQNSLAVATDSRGIGIPQGAATSTLYANVYHFSGEHTIAIYLTHEDNTVNYMAVDIDSKTGKIGSVEDTHEMALRIKELGERYGLSIYLEDSGSKGRHCWLFFSSPVSAGEARQLGKLLIGKAGPINVGIACEIFPKQDRISSNSLGSLIKLPLGVHQLTRRRYLFLADDGSPLPDQGGVLFKIRQVSPEIVRTAIARLSGKVPAFSPINKEKNGPVPDNIQRLVKGCNVLKYLVDRARETKHLNHSERLVLLYTFGHIGEEGARFLHQVMSYCDNYIPAVTQKWINRLEQGRSPISCSRIKDWLYDVIPVIGCACTGNIFQGKYPSPMFYIQEMVQVTEPAYPPHNGAIYNSPVSHIPEKIISLDEEEQKESESSISLDELWSVVEDDIFSEEG